eukprot:Rhum_TRINITY_DN9680_c0_g1::Rhum_TRINITY_DN9680_c0_g1_i1::g.34655::m.34655
MGVSVQPGSSSSPSRSPHRSVTDGFPADSPVPRWYRRAFCALSDSSVQYFGEALLRKGGGDGDEFVVVVVSEGVLFLATRDGVIRSSFDLDSDVASVSRRADDQVTEMKLQEDDRPLRLQTQDCLLESCVARHLLEADAYNRALMDATQGGFVGADAGGDGGGGGVDDGESDGGFTPPRPSTYVARDDVCTACDTGSLADYAVAAWFCVDCDEKLCGTCWEDMHRGVERTRARPHVRQPLALALATGGRGTPLEAELPSVPGLRQPPAVQLPGPSVGASARPGTVGFVRHDGWFLPKGSDALPPKYATVAEALALAGSTRSVEGFTFKEVPGETRHHVFFKSECPVLRQGRVPAATAASPFGTDAVPADGTWVSYLRRDGATPSFVSRGGASTMAPGLTTAHERRQPADPYATLALLPPPTPQQQPGAEPGAAGSPPERETWLPESFHVEQERHTRRIKKAVLVACDYHGTASKCHNSYKSLGTLRSYLEKTGLCSEMRVLTDNNPAAMPTRAAITSCLRWLASGVGPGDTALFAFVGHGGNLCLAPCDHGTAGFVTQHDFIKAVVEPLGMGTKVLVFTDFCRGGSFIDLPHRLSENNASPHPCELVAVNHDEARGRIVPHVVSLAGNRSRQAACDVGGETLVPFICALNTLSRPTYRELLVEAVSYLRLSKAGDVDPRDHEALMFRKPCLEVSSSRPFHGHDEFVLCCHREDEDRDEALFRSMFAFADLDRDGFLCYRDMAHLCGSLGKTITEPAYHRMREYCGGGRGEGSGAGLTYDDFKMVYRKLGAGRGFQEDHRMLMRLQGKGEETDGASRGAAKDGGSSAKGGGEGSSEGGSEGGGSGSDGEDEESAAPAFHDLDNAAAEEGSPAAKVNTAIAVNDEPPPGFWDDDDAPAEKDGDEEEEKEQEKEAAEDEKPDADVKAETDAAEAEKEDSPTAASDGDAKKKKKKKKKEDAGNGGDADDATAAAPAADDDTDDASAAAAKTRKAPEEADAAAAAAPGEDKAGGDAGEEEEELPPPPTTGLAKRRHGVDPTAHAPADEEEELEPEAEPLPGALEEERLAAYKDKPEESAPPPRRAPPRDEREARPAGVSKDDGVYFVKTKKDDVGVTSADDDDASAAALPPPPPVPPAEANDDDDGGGEEKVKQKKKPKKKKADESLPGPDDSSMLPVTARIPSQPGARVNVDDL